MTKDGSEDATESDVELISRQNITILSQVFFFRETFSLKDKTSNFNLVCLQSVSQFEL